MPELPDLDWFKGRSNYLEEQNKDRDKMYEALDNYRHGEWSMDEELLEIDWVTESRDPIFAQQTDSAKQILSDVSPSISLTPYNPGDDGTDIADRHEKGLRWFLAGSSKRRQATVVQDTVSSAVDYSEVTAQVMYLPQQIKDVKAAGGNAKRYEAMLRQGPFATIFHNPKTVHARYSDMGPEEVLLVTEEDPHNIIDLWGKKADKLKKKLKEAKGRVEPAIKKDYTSYDWRCVWVEWGGEDYEIERKEWPWPFLGWSCRYGGTSLEDRGDFQRKPILANAYHFDLYDDINTVRSMRHSEMIRTTSRARDVFQSDTRTSPDTDASSGDLFVHIDTEETIIPQPQNVPDPAMSELYSELRGDFQKSGLSDMLLGSDVPTGAAFASINIVSESAMKVLRSPQSLAQNALADILETMLLYIHYSDSEEIAYGTGKTDRGEQYLIKGSEIDPKNLYVTVKLEADLPTDYQARTVTARAQIDAGINSREGAAEDIGKKNTTELMEQIASERLVETMLAIELKNIAFANDVQQRQEIQAEITEQLMSDPAFLQQIAQQMQAQSPNGAERRPGEPPRGVQQFSGDAGPESLIPSEANAAEGGPATEVFGAQEIRARQQEGL